MDDELRHILGEINKNMATKDDIGHLESEMGGMRAEMGGMRAEIDNISDKMVTKDDLAGAVKDVRKIVRGELRDVRIEFGRP